MKDSLLADISREFLKKEGVYKYRMKKISDMEDDEVIRACHSYVEEVRLRDKWLAFREKAEEDYNLCPYLNKFIPIGMCYDMQLIADGYIKPSALPELELDRERLSLLCESCQYALHCFREPE